MCISVERHLFSIYCWFLNTNSLLKSLQLMLKSCWSDTCIFSTRCITAFLTLGSTSQPFSTTFGGHFKQHNHQQNGDKNRSHVTLNRPWKGCLFTVWEFKKEGKSTAMFNLNWECVCRGTQIVCSFMHVSEWLQKTYRFGGYGQIIVRRQVCKYRIHE